MQFLGDAMIEPYLCTSSVSRRNVSEMTKFAVQLVAVDRAAPVLRAQLGYISALSTHGTGPIPNSILLSACLIQRVHR